MFQIPKEKVRRRADFFLAEAAQMCAEPRYSSLGFELAEDHAQHLAEAYFLVNEAYKAHRQYGDHKTQLPKIAAITSTVVATINPLRPAKPPAKATAVTTYANPLFALRLAASIIDFPFHTQPWVRTMWFCDGIRTDTLPCLDGYLEQTRNGSRLVGDPLDLNLTLDELRRLEGRFNFFYVLDEMPVYKKSAADS